MMIWPLTVILTLCIQALNKNLPGLPAALAAGGGRLALTLANEASLAKAIARDEQLAFALAQEGSGLSLALALVGDGLALALG